MADEYADKMSRKPLSELLLYVQNRAEYREDAVLAALNELEQRGEQPAEAAAIRAELLPVVEKQREEKAKAIVLPVTRPDDVVLGQVPASEEGPALYSPGTIVLFSMLFSFLAGGALLIINMFRLKEAGKALRIVLFIVVLLLASSYGLKWMMNEYKAQARFFSVGVNLIAVLAYLLYFWPRYVGPRPYVSRQWFPALLVCAALLGGLYLLAAPFMGAMPK
jgi:hypothetical protein